MEVEGAKVMEEEKDDGTIGITRKADFEWFNVNFDGNRMKGRERNN